MNVTARVDSNTLGLQGDLHQFDAIRKEKKGKAYPNFRTRTNRPSRRVQLAYGTVHVK